MNDIAVLRSHGRKTSPDTRRAMEHAVKRRAVAFRRWLDAINRQAPAGAGRLDPAGLLGLGGPCLDHWTRRWKSGRRQAESRGRPTAQAPNDTLGKVNDILEHLGPAVSAATLMGLCPELGRNEAERRLADWRGRCVEEHRATVTALQWTRPGTVWAMDHTRPPGAVDGRYPYVLLVRDLASRFQVAAMPQEAATDRAVADALVDLFTRHGAPLAIKSDNHGAFTGRAVREVMDRYGVLPLISPPYLPRYNGAVEAGVGQFKTRAHILAARMNRPGAWTADDVEGARIMANRTLRPQGKDRPTPEERWKTRQPLSGRERTSLRQAYEARLAENGRNPSTRPDDGGGAVFRVERRTVEEERRPAVNPAPSGAPGNVNGTASKTPLSWWARVWNASPSPGHRRPWERGPAMPGAAADPGGRKPEGDGTETMPNDARKDGEEKENSVGQTRKDGVNFQQLKRRSLKDALVAAGLLIIRKRRIPLPIKRIMRLKIS